MKPNDMTLCLTRSAALAAVQALVVWHEMGHFISLIERFDNPRHIANGRSEVYLRARLNSGCWVSCFCVVIPKAAHAAGEYPIEHVLVSFDEACGAKQHRHFLCELSPNGILFPHSWEEVAEF